MIIGECKQGDVVWIVEMLDKTAIQIEVLGESTDATFLMPSKNVRVLTDPQNYKWVTTVFYSSECYATMDEADDEAKKLKIDESYKDPVSMTLFSTTIRTKQRRLNLLEAFVKKLENDGVIAPNDLVEFEKKYNEENSQLIVDLLNNAK